jgi:TIR domain/Tetratricopeptide repeat
VRSLANCYRRDDAAADARLLQIKLSERFPDAQVFMDLDSIGPGVRFAEVIRNALNSSAVLVALIGRQWAELTDEEGNRRLNDPDDLVRFEIETALKRGVWVIPVLVNGARPPRQQQLPAGLQELAGLNAVELNYARLDYDAGQLLDAIERVLAVPRNLAGADRKTPEKADRPRPELILAQPPPGQADSQTQATAEFQVLLERAQSTWDSGDVAGARDQLAALVPAMEQVLGPEHPDTLDARLMFANATGDLGDVAGARDQLAALLPVMERVLGPEHPATLTARQDLHELKGMH